MKKMYFEEPEMEVVHFDAEDVIATSGCPAYECNTDYVAGVECRDGLC